MSVLWTSDVMATAMHAGRAGSLPIECFRYFNR